MKTQHKQSLMEQWDRRKFITGVGLGATAFLIPGAYADALMKTPRQTEGPFYPNKLPLDTDNDLLIINDSISPATGEIVHLTGTIRNIKGDIIRNALVEIWQVDSKGAYLHTGDVHHKQRDINFQGYGRFSTDLYGRFYFRTIKPISYPGRTPHIHAAVSQKGRRMLTTQCYIKAEAKRNMKDHIYQRIGAEGQRLVTLDFNPIIENTTGEFAAHWDIIIGMTPED